ncbi:hypothetical protein GVW62_004234 [Salmonella enterica]|nr:hypothetical protein [Salmonella enterica]
MSTSRFTPANHLLPTLFDRLCDNAPYQKIDRDISVTPVQLKEIIRRDLSFLLNTISHEGDIDARRYPQAAFREAQESAERLQVWARETLGDLAPDFSRLRQLLALLPDVVQTTTPEIPPSPAPVPDPAGTVMDNAVPARAEDVPPVNAPPGISLPHNAEPGPIRDRNDALERLRCIRRWFEGSEPSSPTIPLLRQAERLVGKRFSEVINEIPVELLEKWDALE